MTIRSPWRTNPWLQPCICRATSKESPANIAFIQAYFVLVREDTRDILESDVGLYRRAPRRHPRSRVTFLILNTRPAHARWITSSEALPLAVSKNEIERHNMSPTKLNYIALGIYKKAYVFTS